MGGQLKVDLNELVGFVGTFWWAPTHAIATTSSHNEPDLDVFSYDFGIEVRPLSSLDLNLPVTPFVALGAGGRTYSFRDLDEDPQTNYSTFAAMGGEFAIKRLALRLEARGYLSDYDDLTGLLSESNSRTDFVFNAGLSYRF